MYTSAIDNMSASTCEGLQASMLTGKHPVGVRLIAGRGLEGEWVDLAVTECFY